MLQWMDYGNLAGLTHRTIPGGADAKLLDELAKAARDTKTSDQAQRLDKYREELGKLVGKGTIGWDDAMLLGQLAEEIRP